MTHSKTKREREIPEVSHFLSPQLQLDSSFFLSSLLLWLYLLVLFYLSSLWVWRVSVWAWTFQRGCEHVAWGLVGPTDVIREFIFFCMWSKSLSGCVVLLLAWTNRNTPLHYGSQCCGYGVGHIWVFVRVQSTRRSNACPVRLLWLEANRSDECGGFFCFLPGLM